MRIYYHLIRLFPQLEPDVPRSEPSKHKPFRPQYVLCLLLALLTLLASACVQMDADPKAVVIYGWNGNEDEITLENNFLALRFLPATAEIALTEKAGGAVWRSNPEGAANDAAADGVTMQLLRSQFSLLYGDSAGVGMTLSSSMYSVEKGMYEYAIIDNGLEVNYTVGNVPRLYAFPLAAPEARMVAFWDNMPGSDRSKVDACYRLYDLDNLRASDDKNALLSDYPDLADGRVYILRDTTPEYMKAQIEDFFAAAGYTSEDYAADSDRYHVAETERPIFNVTIRYELDGNSLLVSVPFDKIAYKSDYPITQLNVLPFFGAGGADDDGYLFVPDGSGALIYFNNGKQNQTPYSNNVYGWDEGMPREAIINDNKAPYPVFGVEKNGAAILCVIEEGAAYASVRADISGRNCSYNRVSAQFTMIHGATMDISGKSDKAVYMYESGLPAGERIVQRFIPCAVDGYVGMAKEYRAYLRKKYPSLSKGVEGGVPIAVEIIGAVNKTQHRLGIPFDLPLKLTSYKEAAGMINDFAEFGWKNAHVKMIGWFNKSVEHSVPSNVRLISELGGKNDFSAIATTANNNGFHFYAEGDFLYMRDGFFDSFDLYRDAARYVSRERVEAYPYSFVWFGRNEMGKLSYLASPGYMVKLIDGFVKNIARFGVKNIAFRNLGAKLADDYNEKRFVSREATMNIEAAQLAELTQTGAEVMINTGYAYAAPYASFITDMALGDQSFGITDVAVPFYEIALHGLTPYTGRAINLAEDYTKNLLQSIEGGAGLYFSFMTEEVSVLQETRFQQFYANEYAKWINDANALYQKFVNDFDGLYSQTIENHAILAPSVTLTEYAKGTKVVVNASSAVFYYDGVQVSANNYVVIK
jgi:hypothetical protein